MCVKYLRKSKGNRVARAQVKSRMVDNVCVCGHSMAGSLQARQAVPLKAHRFKRHKSQDLRKQFKLKHRVRSQWKEMV